MLTANRGLCGGFNGNLQRRRLPSLAGAESKRFRTAGWKSSASAASRPSSSAASRRIPAYTHFEDKPSFDEVDVIASRYLDEYTTGKLDRLDVVYTKFVSIARQQVSSRRCCR